MSLVLYLSALFLTIIIFCLGKIKQLPSISNNYKRKYVIRKKILYVIAAFIPLWIIIAFRDSSVGTDTGITYYRVFQHALNGSFQVYADNVEVGYLTLVNILAKISSDYFIVIFVTGTLVWGIFYYYIVHNDKNLYVDIGKNP